MQQNRSNANRGLEFLPPGGVADSRWLSARGLSRFQASRMAQGGKLERLTQGVYRRPRPGDSPKTPVDAFELILSLQNPLDVSVHVGGAGALALRGYSHYLYLGQAPEIEVHSDGLPKWAMRVNAHPRLRPCGDGLFDDPELGVDRVSPVAYGIYAPDPTWTLALSSSERAVFEMLEDLPAHGSFHLADTAFESLNVLRPQLLNELLATCSSVKASRLFLVFAERHAHSWLHRIDPGAANLGAGKRSLVKGGKLHPKYRITIPEELVSDGGGNVVDP